MKQLFQKFSDGKIFIEELPLPSINDNEILINSKLSLISSGTEKMLLDFGKSSLIGKALNQPERVKQVISKAKTDGIVSTYDAVKSKLDNPSPLGYCNFGIIEKIGSKVKGFKLGDRVISNGPHSDFVVVTQNLCSKVPDSVKSEEAVFTVLGSIALNAVRNAQISIGETVVVYGLGLLGLLTAQILIASGCKVIGIDVVEKKLQIADKLGVHTIDGNIDTNAIIHDCTITSNRQGADAVMLTLSTNSNLPMSIACNICRQRGNIVLVGNIGNQFDRNLLYNKELNFKVSMSYGPGRYDDNYEKKGLDYPIGFVRWTENRNFEAILKLFEDKKISINDLISAKFDFSDFQKAYQEINNQESLGILLNYENNHLSEKQDTINLNNSHIDKSKKIIIDFIGSGSHASRHLLPNLSKNKNIALNSVCSKNGASSSFQGKKFNFKKSTTNFEQLFSDNSSNCIFIASNHDSHSFYVKKSIISLKHIFVEKPLCLNISELNEIKDLYEKQKNKKLLMVGFNRRFSPLAVKMSKLLRKTKEPMQIIINVNAGQIDENHWTQDQFLGGGRIIGEVCHFIDLTTFISGSKIIKSHRSSVNLVNEDIHTFNFSFENGSIATIHYYSNGHKDLPKENIEVRVSGKVLVLNNFISLKGYGWSNFSSIKLFKQNKGHKEMIDKFINAITEIGTSPIPIDEIFETSKISFNLANYE